MIRSGSTKSYNIQILLIKKKKKKQSIIFMIQKKDNGSKTQGASPCVPYRSPRSTRAADCTIIIIIIIM